MEDQNGPDQALAAIVIQALLRSASRQDFLLPASPTLPPVPSDSDDEPIAKRHKLGLTYSHLDLEDNYLELQSGEQFYFSDDDGKNILLPESAEPNIYVRKILSHLPKGVAARLKYLAKFRNETDGYNEHGRKLYDHLRDQVYSAYLRECRLKTAFRQLAQRWRIKRIDRHHETIMDPITLSEPEKEVSIYDQNRKFVFDARSLSQHIQSQLLHHDGGFAVPMPPRNPWTNLEFSYLHLLSIYYQLHHHRELPWCILTLREFRFHVPTWHKYHHSAITMHAIRRSLQQLDNTDARDMFEDFIFAKMDDLDISCTPLLTTAYHQAILRVRDHWYLESFKRLAFQHYEALHFHKNRDAQINQKCLALFKKQHIFLRDLVQQKIIERYR